MEPERPIEKLLRAWAKKRRGDAGAPLEMHPATRRLLQGEVARQFGKEAPQPRSFSQVLAAWWPRVAWGVAVLALLGILAAIVLPSVRDGNRSGTFARNEPGMLARNEEVASPPPASAPAAAPTVVNAPAGEARLAYDKSAGSEQEKALSLNDGRPEKEKNGALTLGEPVAGERTSSNYVAGADSFKDSESARRDASGALRETPPATLESAAPTRSYGLAGNPALSQNQPAAPAQRPTTLGGALADRPLAGGKLSLDASSQPALQTAAVAPDAKSAVADESLKRVKSESAQVEVALKSLPQPTAAVPPAAATESDRLAAKLWDDVKNSKQLGITQQFTQVDALSRNTARKPSPAAVLVSFQVEQNGRDLRIVDGDGSVYTGYMRAAEAAAEAVTRGVEKPTVAPAFRLQEPKPEQQKAGLASGTQATQYSFSVAGTNRSLNQKVVFNGDFVATNVIFLAAMTNSLATGGSEAKEQRPGATQFPVLLLRNSRISGKASVGGRGEVQINAVPTAR